MEGIGAARRCNRGVGGSVWGLGIFFAGGGHWDFLVMWQIWASAESGWRELLDGLAYWGDRCDEAGLLDDSRGN